MSLPLTLIAAVARNGAIGAKGALLWRLPADMRRFRALTMGKPVLIGRKTWESIGRPLPGRASIVISRDKVFSGPELQSAADLETAIVMAQAAAARLNASEIMVAGGGELYRQTIERARFLRMTEVDLAPEADAFFPQIDPRAWRETTRAPHAKADGEDAAFAFVDYERRA